MPPAGRSQDGWTTLRAGVTSRRWGGGTALAVAAALPAWLAGAAIASGGAHVSVRPTVGSRTTHFVVRFTAQRTGYVGSSWSGYRVVVSGPSVSGRSAHGCTSAKALTVPPTSQGQHVRVTLTPGGRSHAWCKATYAGWLQETVRPACGFRKLCPLARDLQPTFIATMTVGRFSFRVR